MWNCQLEILFEKARTKKIPHPENTPLFLWKKESNGLFHRLKGIASDIETNKRAIEQKFGHVVGFDINTRILNDVTEIFDIIKAKGYITDRQSRKVKDRLWPALRLIDFNGNIQPEKTRKFKPQTYNMARKAFAKLAKKKGHGRYVS